MALGFPNSVLSGQYFMYYDEPTLTETKVIGNLVNCPYLLKYHKKKCSLEVSNILPTTPPHISKHVMGFDTVVVLLERHRVTKEINGYVFPL